ncbi:MAG: hypothetical protein IKS31_10035 [Clostridia bacterium]|nr:hypothetical protein [Clostridia bacterium]
MKRKLLAWVLLIAMAVSLAPAAQAASGGCAPGEHNWVKDPQRPADCTTQGLVFYFCTKCGDSYEEVIPPLGHDWHMTSTSATCLSGGVTRYTCARCGLRKQERVGPLGHDYGPEQPDIPATCTEAGRNVRICRRDATHRWYIEVPALGHDWGEWEVVTPATTEAPGQEQRVCKRDPSHVETREIPHLESDEENVHVDVTGVCPPGPFHAGDEVTVVWTVRNTGTHPLWKGTFEGDAIGQGVPTELDVDESFTWTVVHKLTEEDLDSGFHYNAEEGYYDPETVFPNSTQIFLATAHYEAKDNGYRCYDLESFTRYMLREGEEFIPIIDLDLTVGCEPGPFAPNDYAAVTWTIRNTGNVALTYLDCDGDAAKTTLPAVLEPNESYQWDVVHTITENDVLDGYYLDPADGTKLSEKHAECIIVFLASATYVYTGPEFGMDLQAYDEEIVVRNLTDSGVEPKAELTITNVSAESGLGKVKGDTVQIEVTVKNTGNIDMEFWGVDFTDSFTRSADMDSLHIFENMAVGQEFTETFRLTVTDDDLSAGQIDGDIQATGYVDNDQITGFITSNVEPLVIDLDGEPDPDPDEEAAITLSVTCLTPEPFTFGTDGKTADIFYTAIVTNTGKVPVMTGYVTSNDGSGDNPFIPGSPIVLYPGESLGFGIVNSFADTLVEADNMLHIRFNATFLRVDNGAEVYADEVELKHAVEDVPPWTVSEVILRKSVVGAPADSRGYQEGETVHFVITVINAGDVEIDSVVIHDMIMDPETDQTLYQLEPHEIRSVDFFYTVPGELVGTKIANYARANWSDPAMEVGMESFSNTVYVDTWGERDRGGLVVQKWHEGGPDNGSYYVDGETVQFRVRVENTTSEYLYKVTVKDPLSGAPGDIIAYYDEMQPHEVHIINVPYTVTAGDASMGLVTNVAFGDGVDRSGIAYSDIGSDEVTTGLKDRTASLYILKEEINVPDRGYYFVGETIHYKITIINDGGIDLTDVEVYDSLSETWASIGSITTLHVGQEQSFYFDYETDMWDVPLVYNTATAFYTTPDAINVPVVSNEVISYVVGDDPPDPPDPGEKVSCVTELKGVGDHAAFCVLTPCPVHGKILAEAQELTENADTSEDLGETWKQAAEMWRTATEEMYEAMLAEASGPERPVLTDDRTFFRAYAESYEALLSSLWPDRTEDVYRAVANLWMLQCTELCYLDGNAPAPRPDSLITGKYAGVGIPASPHSRMMIFPNAEDTVDIMQAFDADHGALWQAGRALVAQAVTRDEYTAAFEKSARAWSLSLNTVLSARFAEGDAEVRAALARHRKAFDAMAARREALLKIFYPNAPETVAEVIMNLWRREVMLMSAQ